MAVDRYLNYESFIASFFRKGLCADFNQPLFIPVGGDSFEQIWPAQSPSQFTLDYCRHHYETKIGKPDDKSTATIFDPALDPKYAEPDIDRRRMEMFAKLGKVVKVPERLSENDNQVI